jgi:hypothetical protein
MPVFQLGPKAFILHLPDEVPEPNISQCREIAKAINRAVKQALLGIDPAKEELERYKAALKAIYEYRNETTYGCQNIAEEALNPSEGKRCKDCVHFPKHKVTDDQQLVKCDLGEYYTWGDLRLCYYIPSSFARRTE